jgi:hypothetical protein
MMLAWAHANSAKQGAGSDGFQLLEERSPTWIERRTNPRASWMITRGRGRCKPAKR